MPNYVNLELTFSGSAPAYAVLGNALGGDARGTFTLPQDAAFQTAVQRIASFAIGEDELTQLGETLFNALFAGDIKRLYDRVQAQVDQDDEQRMRLRLNIDPRETALASLPWEFMRETDQQPLVLLDVPLVRYIPQLANVPTVRANLPLKVLITAAQTPPPADVARELADVQAALEGLGSQVEVTVEPHLTPRALQRLLRERFHVWHFVGHGGYSADRRNAQLFFEDTSGGVQTVSAGELQIFLNRTSIRLIVLDACNSATISAEPFRALAPALIRAQVPAVVAMQFRAPEDSTQAFASEFYRALAEGLPIEACVTEGRKAVMSVAGLDTPDWGIPVVYSRAPDGVLFELPSSQPEAAPATPTTSGSNVNQHGVVNVNVEASTLDASPISVSNVGNAAQNNASQAGAVQQRADELAALNDALRLKRRRLYALQKQAAMYGINTDPSISIQIEDLQKEIAQDERRAQELD